MTSDNMFERAQRLITAEQYASALTAVETALVTDPQANDLRYLKGVALLGLKRCAEALPLIVQALTSTSVDAKR